MPDAQDKITIRHEELVEKPPSLPITIRPDEIPADAPTAARQEPALQAVLIDDPSRVLAFRYLLVALGVVLAGMLMFAALSAVVYLALPKPDWIEQAAARADRSVVLIESGSDVGTGFVVASDGDTHLILTNRHVVEENPKCSVHSRLGHEAAGISISYPKNPNTDLALLIATTPGLNEMGPIGDFRDVRVGQAVVAVGHPLGLDFTVTNGIISAKRDGKELQTTAAISPGNSGGPLVDKAGYVVGVNTRTIDPVEGQSLGFATRADLVLKPNLWQLEAGVGQMMSRIPR